MKRSIVLLTIGILFAAISVIATIFVLEIPALIAVITISVPISLTFIIYGLSAGTKDGDIPFVGY